MVSWMRSTHANLPSSISIRVSHVIIKYISDSQYLARLGPYIALYYDHTVLFLWRQR